MVFFLRLCVLVFLVVSCSAECYILKSKVDLLSTTSGNIVNHMQGCVDSEGKTHELDSEWERDCYSCVCKVYGIECCNKIPKITDLPDDCEMTVDKTTCSFSLVRVSDNSKQCEFA